MLGHLRVSNSQSQSCVRSMLCESLDFHIRSYSSSAVTSMDTWQIARLISGKDIINCIKIGHDFHMGDRVVTEHELATNQI